MSDAQYLTAAEAAGRLGISLRTARRRIADGSLPSVRIGRAVRVPASALDLPVARTEALATRESVAPYEPGMGADAGYVSRWNAEHWPDTYERLLERRRRAFKDLERLRQTTRPPGGPHNTVDAMLDAERSEFGERLMPFLPPRPEGAE